MEQNHPELLQPENKRLRCGWSDKDFGQTDAKLLCIQTGPYFSNFNWIQDGESKPTPGRARNLSGVKQNPEDLKSLIQDWIRICKEGHKQCHHVWSQKSVKDLRLRFIDVKRWCLVSAKDLPDSSYKYVALSYVWGTKVVTTTDASNIAQFSRDGGLKSAALPATIEGAIRLVEVLDIPFLWVDALCIVQQGGDPAEKAVQIQNMDSVYGLAEFTVVQATGADSSCPLLGFDDHGPQHGNQRRQIQGEVRPGLRLSLQSNGFDDRQKAASKWNTRAWTFQEAVLSPRMLIWHDGFLTWECREAVWSDDTIPGATRSSVEPQFGAQMLPLLPERLKAEEEAMAKLPFIEPRGRHDNISLYEGAVQEYTSREMSYWTDKLIAFAGIGAVFERQMSTKLLYGLPRDQLDTSLLWSAYKGPLERLSGFPSWSWAGWKGAVRYGSQNPLSLAPSLAYYILSGDVKDGVSTEDGRVVLRRLVQTWEAEGYVPPTRPWTIKVGAASENTPHVQHPPTHEVPANMDLAHCLCFKAYCVSASHFSFDGYKVIQTISNKIVGGILLDVPSLPTDHGQLDLVMLSHCSASSSEHRKKDEQEEYFPDDIVPHPNLPDIRQFRGKHGLPVPHDCCRFLLVEKQDDGTAVRKGMGEMSKAAWNRVGVYQKWVYLA